MSVGRADGISLPSGEPSHMGLMMTGYVAQAQQLALFQEFAEEFSVVGLLCHFLWHLGRMMLRQ